MVVGSNPTVGSPQTPTATPSRQRPCYLQRQSQQWAPITEDTAMPWYESESAAIVLLFVCPPVGVVLVWLYQSWDIVIKAVASVFSLTGSLLVLMAVANMSAPRAPGLE